jgi:excisionase family DNA binding protein
MQGRMRSLMSTVEAARRLERPERTVRRWIQAGRLRGQKVGRSWVVEESAVAELELAHRGEKP